MLEYANGLPQNEMYFANGNNRNMINIIFTSTEFAVNVCSLKLSTQKKFAVIVERYNSHDMLQIRLTDILEQTNMFTATIDGSSFESIKVDQSLHVTFMGFVENLIAILNSCRKDIMQIRLIQEQDNFNLQFYEVRAFKNLIHLNLPVQKAPLSVVLFHMCQIITSMQKKHLSYESTIIHMQNDLSQKNEQISQLKNDLIKLNTNHMEQNNILHTRDNKEINHLQQTLKNLSEAKEADENRLKQTIGTLQNRVDHLSRDCSNLKDQKIQEMKRTETLREEICVLKSNITNIKEQNEKLHADLATLRNLERKNEVHNSDLKKQVHDLQETIKRYEKLKSEYSAELEAERKICHTKRNALQMATEEIAKANEIITKQSKDITDLKKTVDWRTEVALQQEYSIRVKESELKIQSEKLQYLENELKRKHEEYKTFSNQFDVMKELANSIEKKYSEKIAILSEKISTIDKENRLPTTIRAPK